MNKILIALVFTILIIFPYSSFAQAKTPTPTVKYDLPYPGKLPDSPFYKLKVLRNKIILVFIKDPLKKSKYHLLLADKQIYMSKLLVDKGKTKLAQETALKGENEYTLITFLLKDTRSKPGKAFFDRLQLAALKHQEILNGIVSKVKDKDKKTFETVIDFSIRNANELEEIYNE